MNIKKKKGEHNIKRKNINKSAHTKYRQLIIIKSDVKRKYIILNCYKVKRIKYDI